MAAADTTALPFFGRDSGGWLGDSNTASRDTLVMPDGKMASINRPLLREQTQ